MRRERRQHGLVRTFRILPPPLNPRLVNSLSSPPTNLPSIPNRKLLSGQVHWLRSNHKLVTNPGPRPVLTDLDNGCEDKGGETRKREKEDHDGEQSMSFYDVGMMMMEHVLDEDDEDGWCLV